MTQDITHNLLQEKILREHGLCTSVACDDKINAVRAKFILDTFIEWYYGKTLCEYEMQVAQRASNEWERIEYLPFDFASTVYRLHKYADKDEGESPMRVDRFGEIF